MLWLTTRTEASFPYIHNRSKFRPWILFLKDFLEPAAHCYVTEQLPRPRFLHSRSKQMKARQCHGLAMVAWAMVCLASAAFLSTSPPLGHHHQRAATAPPAARKRKQVDAPTPAPTILDDRGIVVVVVNEKSTRFYQGLLRPPFTHQAPTATYVHPPDPYQFEV